MRYQKEFEYIYETIEKLHVTITTQSEALSILAENDFDKDDSKDLTLLGCKLSHFWNLSKHHSQNMAFHLELIQLNDVVLKLNQESLIEVECSLLLQQAEVIVPLLKTKQSISLVIEEKFSQLRDDIGLMLSTNGCYDINHLTPYLEKGNKDQRLSLMYILDWLFPDNAIFAFPKCATNCSNNKLVSPSPTPAVPRNIISASTKADLDGEEKESNSKSSESKKIRKYGKAELCEEKKVPNSKLSKSKKIRKYGKADLYGEKKVQNSKLSESMKIRKYGIIGKSQPSGINKSKSTFGSPSKRKQNSKSSKANNRLPEICKSLISFDSDEYPDILPFQLRLLLKRPRVKIK